ncbi:hypothetical protein FQN60_004530 [Etheostoma spectabile]|uniref:Uncharacterized protein n=1 Tax=Etheostoma spectabile TaxID=54343 RepID=A0A5J5DJV8_9PERO|nr:hypothetical protein FQN60_004530 [Etheostoma spectabile]
MEPYISLTTRYIDADFHHTGQNLANGLREALAAWRSNEEKLICFTSDNASNIKLHGG